MAIQWLQIDPTTQDGVFSWTVDGTDQLYQKWFWLRASSSASQISVDELGKPFGFSALSSSNATVTYFGQGFAVNLEFTLTGGAIGSYASAMAENISIQNTTNIPITLYFYEYSDFDLAGQSPGDTVPLLGPDMVVQQGKGMMMTETIQTPTPNYWEASWYSITLDKLNEDSYVTLSDESITPSSGRPDIRLSVGCHLGRGAETYNRSHK